MSGADGELVTALQEHAGDGLRVVGHHDADSWNVEYMREDVQSNYETDAVDEIADDLVLSQMGGGRQDELYELGSLEATVRLFEDGIVVHVPTDDHSGHLVSLDDDADVRGRSVVDLVRRTVD
jgi:hypothetical protein